MTKAEKAAATKITQAMDLAGPKLFEAEEAISQLFTAINYGPELTYEQDAALETLGHVRNLIRIAFELYPYPVRD